MPTLNNGSIALNIYNSISPIPAGVSGLLITLVDTQRFFVEQFTGDTIGNAITEKYQPAISDLSTANVLKLMAVQDMGVASVSIGDLTTNNSNLKEMAAQFENKGMSELKALTKGIKFYKSRG